MASYRVMRRRNQTDSSVLFEVDAYANVLLHPMVRSLVLQDEEDYKSYKISFHNQMRGKSKGEYNQSGFTTRDQIRLHAEKSRTIETSVNNSTGMLLPQGHECKGELEKLKFSNQECVPQRETKENMKKTSDTMLLRNGPEYRSIYHKPRSNFCEHAVTKYRERLSYYEARRLQRHSEQLGIEYRPLLALNTDNSYFEDRKNEDFDDLDAKEVKSVDYHEEVEGSFVRMREHVSVIRDRIRPSRTLLAKHDPDESVGTKDFNELNLKGQFWSESQSIAFTPKIEKSASWNGAVGCDSHSFPKTQDGLNPLDSSRGDSYSRADSKISISAPAMSTNEKLTVEKDAKGANSKPKEINKLTVVKRISEMQKVLICASNRKKFHDGRSGQWSQGTADGSSCATPSTVNCDDSRSRSNKSEDGSKKNEKSWKSLSSFTQEKSLKDEWLRTSIARDNLRTESEIEMQEWLNSSVVQGWDVARQEAARCGPMEMVFYDRTTPLRSNLKSQ